MIPNRPKISDADTDKIVSAFFTGEIPPLVVVGVRGYFLNAMGKPGANDFNIWDDGVLVYENGNLVKTFNANTDPSKANSGLAVLDTGVYHFAKGMHKDRIRAFRAYPEGVRLKCKRVVGGVSQDSFCSYINFHDGGVTNTWSAGCQTIINDGSHRQFDEFRNLVYSLMDKYKLKFFTYLLIDEKQMRDVLAV